MLRIAINEAVDGGRIKLRAVADALVDEAMNGNVAAIKEVADRLDGKVPQAVIGSNDHDPINITSKIECVIIDNNGDADNQGS